MTPEGLMAALAPYAEMTTSSGAGASSRASGPSSRGTGLSALKKGLTISEVESLLGPANTASESREGSLTVMKRTYVVDGRKISISFVNDVLIEYILQ